jgi:hypothetical protein
MGLREDALGNGPVLEGGIVKPKESPWLALSRFDSKIKSLSSAIEGAEIERIDRIQAQKISIFGKSKIKFVPESNLT